MTEDKYQVVLSGELAEGKTAEDVKKRMAALFKTSPDKIEALLKKRGAVVKRNIDIETAKKYARAIESTGAKCRTDPMPEQESTKQAAPAAEKDTEYAEPNVIEVQLLHAAEDRFAPQSTEKITPASGGLNLNLGNLTAVTYDQIVALSTFTDSKGGNEKEHVLIFTNLQAAPVICDINNIAYSDFPIKVLAKPVACLRNFLHFLCRKNPAINIEEATFDFLSGSPPQKLDQNKALKLATNMGKLIETGTLTAQI